MPKPNPYLDEIQRAYVPEDFDAADLATLAIVHELRERNRLTEAINAPTRVVANVQAPISPEDLGAQKIMALPDDSGDARIAAAARRWAVQHSRRRTPAASGAALGLAAAELAEVIRQEDER